MIGLLILSAISSTFCFTIKRDNPWDNPWTTVYYPTNQSSDILGLKILDTDDESDDTWMINDSTNKTDLKTTTESIIATVRAHQDDATFIKNLDALLKNNLPQTKAINSFDVMEKIAPYVPESVVKSKDFWKFVAGVLPNTIKITTRDGNVTEEKFWERTGTFFKCIVPAITPYIETDDQDFGTNTWMKTVTDDMDKAVDGITFGVNVGYTNGPWTVGGGVGYGPNGWNANGNFNYNNGNFNTGGNFNWSQH